MQFNDFGFNNFGFGEFSGGGYFGHQGPSESERMAIDLSIMSIQRLADMQKDFAYISEQIKKLKLIHPDEISSDIYNSIINICDGHQPKE